MKKKKKKTFKIVCEWVESGEMYVEANSLEEAIEIAENSGDPLPNGDYLNDSFRVNKEITELNQ